MPPTGQRGSGPAHPRDFTGTLLKQQQQQKQKQQELETADISAIRHAAYQRGYDAGYSDGIRFVQDNFDVFELEDEDNEE
jgi:flagellar biosynthesis/type III secretory pathway protein FliH